MIKLTSYVLDVVTSVTCQTIGENLDLLNNLLSTRLLPKSDKESQFSRTDHAFSVNPLLFKQQVIRKNKRQIDAKRTYLQLVPRGF